MKINTLHSYLNYLRRKDPIGGSISVPEFNTLCEIVVFQYFRKIVGLPVEYQKGARDPVNGKGLNDISEEKLRPLKVLPTSIVVDANGYADYPADYFRHGPCGYVYTAGSVIRNIMVPFVNDDKFKERQTTVLDPPSLFDPVANLHTTKIRFLPVSLAGVDVKLEYIKFPTKPVMGYVIDIDTAETVYVENGACIQVTAPGVAGNTITASSGATAFGAYTVLANDTAEEVMRGLMDAINVNTLAYGVKAVYDGEKIVLVDSHTTPYTTLTVATTGSVAVVKTNFSNWSVQFDWEDDIESMNEIAEMLLDRMGISNRDIPIVQYAEKEQAK